MNCSVRRLILWVLVIFVQLGCSIQGSVVDLSENDIEIPSMIISARGFSPSAQQLESSSGYVVSSAMEFVEGSREEHSGYTVHTGLEMTIVSQ